jgi:hypothetical protein
MTPSTSLQDLSAQWKSACRLYPIYFELAREFAIDVKTSAELETGGETPGKETVEQAQSWLEEMDQLIQVHQLRQFLQTSSLVNQEGLLNLLEHFLALTARTEATRDKIDFLLVQYFSQLAPSGVRDAEVDLAYVAQSLESILGEIELKPPVWLNALDRVLEAAGHCRSLDELLHGGVLEQGRKAKGLAGDLFYLPIALVAFTRFGYLMRRSFFRLMLGDLNLILDGLTELEDKGVVSIDCRRAQFSAQEPIVRLRMICQSWKVMFQAEYSSGQPLRMLVDLRAAVDQALGRSPGSEAEARAESKPASAGAKPIASAAAAGASEPSGKVAVAPAGEETPEAQPSLASSESAEFEVSSAPNWAADSESEAGNQS